ncbi:tetratricopeptide repeat protein [Kamptonema cortianum]|uniref:Tetratricopeptide repeat protein n=1 Tax=Geitlerinema calcuttense NRMC-F 0142 TaxID=2922238 RepID=A0ABT7M062_9CYAN|nr:tetratricopeptide repeat protein [Geitlerinema calcuttense]MDK3160113.1 tetratricopeptide repeat protein [Kamptonema cortianum]MDL5057638.1 tetratricopeptide repeat protein [Geitlerinema calcuttense NRMC-F 0142]
MQKVQANSEYQDQLDRRAKTQMLQRAIAAIGLLSFLGGAAFTAFDSVKQIAKSGLTPTEVTAPTVEDQLASQEKGFQSVLAREPQNAVALEGLARVRWQQNDFQGALEPVETLVKLYPNRPEFQSLLSQVQEKLAETQPSQ